MLTYERENEIIEGNGLSECVLSIIIDHKYQVTTCYRESSAAINSPPWYYETYIWKLDGKGDRVQIGDATGEDPFEVARQIAKEGWPFMVERDEEEA